MAIIIAMCGLAIVFAYEIRYRVVTEHLLQLDNEAHGLRQEVKKLTDEIKNLKEEVAKKQDADTKKGFKFPFFPDFK